MKFLARAALVLAVCIAMKVTVGENKDYDLFETINTIMNKPSVMEKSQGQLYIGGESVKLGKYEPLEGCYLGAYVLANQNINYDMAEFEKITDVEHSIYNYNINMGNSFPQTWVLECIANMKVPCITIYPSENQYIFSEEAVKEMAEKFSEFNIPMFINFYPNPEKYEVEAQEYKEFYKKAREIFDIYMPSTAFIWSIDIKNVYTSDLYYPEVCDWAGISIYEDFEDKDIYNSLEIFYNNYKLKKPIMITQLGIAHYSAKNHNYLIEEAQQSITELYQNIMQKYPRIKAVNYMDIDLENRYKITENKELLQSYKQAAENDYFKSSLTKEENRKLYIKSSFDMYKYNDQLYISKNCLMGELKIKPNKKKTLSINGEEWYLLDNIKRYTDYDILVK